MNYKYDAVQFEPNGWMVHRCWIDEYRFNHVDESLLYGHHTAETAIQAAIERGSWA